jgi:hypothetical protein
MEKESNDHLRKTERKEKQREMEKERDKSNGGWGRIFRGSFLYLAKWARLLSGLCMDRKGTPLILFSTYIKGTSQPFFATRKPLP